MTEADIALTDMKVTVEGGGPSEFVIRKTYPSDIDQINRLFFEEYGREYPFPITTIQSSGVYLAAWHEPTKTIVGFARAMPYGKHAHTWEFGGLIVQRQYRGRNIAKYLTTIRVNVARRCGARVIVSEPVCYRHDCASQRNLIFHGFVLLGVQPGKYPDILKHRLGNQGESVLLAAKWIGECKGFDGRKVYLPPDYMAAVKQLLPGVMNVDQGWNILLESVPTPVHHHGHETTVSTGTRFVDVPINWASSLEQIEQLRSNGYRLSAVLPGFGTTISGQPFDYVRLYRFEHSKPFDFDRVNVAPQLQRFKEFCHREEAALI